VTWFTRKRDGSWYIATEIETGLHETMGMIRILFLLAALLATTSSITAAVACPSGYVRCGVACCQGR
jgi:hypothetical protein